MLFNIRMEKERRMERRRRGRKILIIK